MSGNKRRGEFSDSDSDSEIVGETQDEPEVVFEGLSCGSTSSDLIDDLCALACDVRPKLFFAGQKAEQFVQTKCETPLGDIYECENLRIFEVQMTPSEVFEILLFLPEKDLYINDRLPCQFQGSGQFAIKLLSHPENLAAQTLNYLKQDGNLGWSQQGSSSTAIRYNEEDVYLLTVYYKNATVDDFRKMLAFIIRDPKDRLPAADFCDLMLLRYYWMKGSTITPFLCTAGRKPKIPKVYLSAVAKKVKPNMARPIPAARHVYNEAANEIPQAMLLKNPALELRSVDQIYRVTQSAKAEHFGKDKLQYLLDSVNVETHCFVASGDGEGKCFKRTVHFVYSQYQLNLLAQFGFGDEGVPVYIDTKFNLSSCYAVVTAFHHPWIVDRTRGTQCLVVGPILLTDYKDEQSYEQFALWLRNKVTRVKKYQPLGTFRIITDDEPGLYNPFINIFDAVHGLCYVHLEETFMRHARSKCGVSEHDGKSMMRDIFGRPNKEDSVHLKGVVDEPDEASMRLAFEKIRPGWKSEKFVEWFLKKGIKKLATKMSTTVRTLLGIGLDLPHTNLIEAINRLLDMEAGKRKLDKCELAERLANLFAMKLQEMAKIIFGSGQYKLVDQHQNLELSMNERTDSGRILRALIVLFNGDPDPHKKLNLYRYSVDQTPVSASINLSVPFEKSGLPVIYRTTFEKAAKLAKEPWRMKEWPYPVDGSKDGDLCIGVLSETNGTTVHLVKLRGCDGHSSCSCPDYTKSQKRICKHIVAVAHDSGNLQSVVDFVLNKQVDRTLSVQQPVTSGYKPSQGPRNLNNSYTKRNGLELLDISASSQSTSKDSGISTSGTRDGPDPITPKPCSQTSLPSEASFVISLPNFTPIQVP